MTMQGSYREVAPPERLVSTESWGPEWPETVNTMVLTESGGTDNDHDHGPLPEQGGARRRAQDGDEVGNGPELREARQHVGEPGLTVEAEPVGEALVKAGKGN